MRRPVKPFVTEYKGPNRRPGHPAGPVARQGEEFSYATAANEAFSRSAVDAPRHNPEDAYEAALRAADALFSPAAAKPAAPAAHNPHVGSLVADRADPPTEAATSEHAGPGNGGRILRAIDEPPAPDLAALEAEHAPKRRGRKPGSKNKLKAPVFEDDAPRSPTRPSASVPPPVFRDEDFDAARPVAAAAPRTSTKASATTYRARDDARFAWVRTKLKPGEEWKRRLPKVCW